MALCSTRLSISVSLSGCRLSQRLPSSATVFAISASACLIPVGIIGLYMKYDAGCGNRQLREHGVVEFEKIRERAAKRKGGEPFSLRFSAPARQCRGGQRPGRPHPFHHGRAGLLGRLRLACHRGEMAGLRGGVSGFEPKRLLFQPDDFWHDLISDKRIVRNPQNHVSARERRLCRTHLQGYGGFGKFLAHGRPTTRSV